MVLVCRRIGVAVVLVALVALAGCSSADPDSGLDSASAAGADQDASEIAGAVGDDGAPSAVEPLRPAAEPETTSAPEVESTSAYISRLSMTSNAIEVKWSDSEGVAEYHIHRIPRTSDDEPPVEAMTLDNRIHVAQADGRFDDLAVVAGTEYWHGVREFSANGDLTAHGWHKTAAIDDEEPPSEVDGITAVAQDGGVLVTWTQPDENYQLHSYRVFRGVDGEPSESVAVTWRLDQLSFFDDEPPTSAQVVYEVVALDFHWNKSSPGGVTIDLS